MAVPRDSVDEILEQWGQERPELDSSGMEVVLRVLQVAGHLQERLKDTLAPAGLAPFEFDVLSALRRAGLMTPTALCETSQLTSGAMTHRLDRLEERGLVRRKAGPRDRRTVLVSLTPRGRKLVDGVISARMEDASCCLEGLRAAQRRELAGLLRQFILSLS